MSTITPHYRSVQQLLQSRSFSIDEYQCKYKIAKSNIDDLLIDLQLKSNITKAKEKNGN